MSRSYFNSDAVSSVKAVSIILMVAGHAGCPYWMQEYLAMFRMPLFFMMSGYCFKMKYLDDARTFVRRRVTGVWWPYVKWGLVFLALHNVFFYLNIYNDVYGFKGQVSHLYTWTEFLRKGVNHLRLCNNEQLLGGFWFLHELFWASLLGYISIKYLKKFKFTGGGNLVLLLLFSYFDLHIPLLGISARTWMASFFFVFGHAWRESEESGGVMSLFYGLPRAAKIVVVALLAVLVKAFMMIRGYCSMLSITFDKSLPYVCAAICGTLMTMYLCQWFVNNSDGKAKEWLVFAGRHTFEVLTWHMILFKTVSLLIIWIYGLPLERLATFPVIATEDLRADGVAVNWTLWWWVYTAVGAGIPVMWQRRRLRWLASR